MAKLGAYDVGLVSLKTLGSQVSHLEIDSAHCGPLVPEWTGGPVFTLSCSGSTQQSNGSGWERPEGAERTTSWLNTSLKFMTIVCPKNQ